MLFLEDLSNFSSKKHFRKQRLQSWKELLKSDDNTDVDVEGFVKFLKQEKLKNAKAAEAEQLLKIDHTYVDVDVDVEGLVKLFKQKNLEDAKAAETVQVNIQKNQN